MNQITEGIAALLLQTGKAHHEAFISSDGDDPEWPLWYATYLQEKLPPLLGQSFTKSELTNLLIQLDGRYREAIQDIPWHRFYAQIIVEQQFAPPSSSTDFLPNYGDVPSLSTEQMIEVDRAMIEDYQISLTQMMENAGRNLAHLARKRFLENDPRGKNVIVLAGTGGNGGGALVAARRLANYGATVTVITTRTADSFRGVPGQQLHILNKMNVPIHQDTLLETESLSADLILDGVIGYSLRGAPHGSAANLIRWANNQDVPVLALDIPSGVDGTTGSAHNPAIVAAATMTLALPKTGLESAPNIGELYLADISVPPVLYGGPGLELEVGSLFARSDIVRLR